MNKRPGNKVLGFFLDKRFYNETWYYYLTGEWHTSVPDEVKRWQTMVDTQRRVYSRLPSDPHCHECGIPMAGFGGNVLRIMGSSPSSFSPKLCSACEKHARQYEVGAEVELTMIFADVRDSTPLAESLGPSEFKTIIGRFYKETSKVLVERNAMVNRLMGDQVIALFVPRFVEESCGGRFGGSKGLIAGNRSRVGKRTVDTRRRGGSYRSRVCRRGRRGGGSH